MTANDKEYSIKDLEEICRKDAATKEGKKMALRLKKYPDTKDSKPKALAKAFPQITALLREGNKVSADDVARELAWVVYAEETKDFHADKQDFRLLAEQVVPYTSGAKDEEERESFRQLLVQAMWVESCKIKGRLKSNGTSDKVLQICFQNILSGKKAQIVSQFFGHDESLFGASCPLAQADLPIKDFMASLQELHHTSRPWEPLRRKLRMLKINLGPLLNRVEGRWGRIKDVCWECDKVVDGWEEDSKPTLACSGCNAARYCGRDCQSKAWKSGHKEGCAVVRAMHQRVLAEAKLMESAHKDPAGHKARFGAAPGTPYCDSQLVNHLCQPAFDPNWGATSIANFYKNIGEVASGNLWVDTKQVVHQPVEIAELEGDMALEKIDDKDFWAIASYLSHDLRFMPTDRGPLFGVIWARLFVSLAVGFKGSAEQQRLSFWWKRHCMENPDIGQRMLPREFLARYVSCGKGLSTKRAKLLIMERSVTTLRKFHKAMPVVNRSKMWIGSMKYCLVWLTITIAKFALTVLVVFAAVFGYELEAENMKTK